MKKQTQKEWPTTTQLIIDSDIVQIKIYLSPELTSLSEHRTPVSTLKFFLNYLSIVIVPLKFVDLVLLWIQ